jgi:NAD(P)-dependent dehydrogenase (short-subunit alcohol dehydrogenase family)
MAIEQKKRVWEQQAIKRFAEPADIVGPILFLTSEDAAFVTGQAVVADGGMYTRDVHKNKCVIEYRSFNRTMRQPCST